MVRFHFYWVLQLFRGKGVKKLQYFWLLAVLYFWLNKKGGVGQKVWKYVYVIYEWLLRKETVADFLANLFKKNSNRGDFINLAQKQLIGQSVMTSYRYLLKLIKFIYSEKATTFCEIFILLLTTVFSEYMNFKREGTISSFYL